MSQGSKLGERARHNPSPKTSANIIIELLVVWAVALSCVNQSADQKRVSELILYNVRNLFRQKNRPYYSPSINCVLHSDFHTVYRHFMNSMRIVCGPVSIVSTVYVRYPLNVDNWKRIPEAVCSIEFLLHNMETEDYA
jgi:hypothetical protein